MMRPVSRRLLLSSALRAAAVASGALVQGCVAARSQPPSVPSVSMGRPIYFVSDPCIGTKDTACVNVCPVDAIHPRRDEGGFHSARMLFIHPDDCIDCGACVPACPVNAIYEGPPEPSQSDLRDANVLAQDPANAARLHAIVERHIEENPRLMATPPDRRRRAHRQAG